MRKYSIGALTKPDEDEEIWTLDIDFDNRDDNGKSIDGRMCHGAIIVIHGDTPSHCMLKAHYICELLNSEGLNIAEVLTTLMEISKVNEPLM